MDYSGFRPPFGQPVNRPLPNFMHGRAAPPPQLTPSNSRGDDESDSSPHRIAHTLTACCRCRQRKTRCDPALPRCLPCDRAGALCEYFDTTKGKKIPRIYVVKLQEKVRQLEAELSQYTDDDEFPRNAEDIVRPGGLVRLNENDETLRYLGPSSGIAMTRLLMEEAKKYTDTKKISELIPDVKIRRLDQRDRMQSIIGYGGSVSGPSTSKKKDFPMMSDIAAESLPNRDTVKKLVDVFTTRAQVMYPACHEVVLAQDVEEVLQGSTDAHKNFLVRMVLAISLQKLDTQYAGLADSYYLAAMKYFEDVIRPKDLKTLQCLVLIAEYSLLTPTRTNPYNIVGLATRICQKLRLDTEKAMNVPGENALTVDMKRRMAWIITGLEYGFSHIMGRPNGFSKGDDRMEVEFFANVDDQYITEDGIDQSAPLSEKKAVAIHFGKMRLLQAEIRRVLYEKKKPEPRNENHPWFAQMEKKIKDWLDTIPAQPAWCGPWFTGRYHTMRGFIFRPSPQVPRPSASAALKCFDSSSYIVNLGSQSLKKAAIDITWPFLLTIYMSLNTVLWAVSSYPEVREAHPKDDLDNLVTTSLEVLDQCAERWPGTVAAAQLYGPLAKACSLSYDTEPKSNEDEPNNSFDTSPSANDSNSPSASEISMPTTISTNSGHGQGPVFNNPQFGYVFQNPEPVNNHFASFEDPFQPQHPQFRSGSIFFNRGSSEDSIRRPSYFAPDSAPADDSAGPGEATPPATTTPQMSPPVANPFPTPPETMMTPSLKAVSSPMTASTHHSSPTPTMPYATPVPVSGPMNDVPPNLSYDQTTPQQTPQTTPQQPAPQPRTNAFTIPPLPQQRARAGIQQRPLPGGTTVTDWFSPPPPFISSYQFGGAGVVGTGGIQPPDLFTDPAATFTTFGLGGADPGQIPASPFGFPNALGRHGSLSQEQQMELLNVLETDGMGEMDTFLNMGMGDAGPRWQ